MPRKKRTFPRRVEIFLEFLLFGVVVGVVEDLIAIAFATDARITWHVIAIAFIVAVPFAFLGEVIVDRKHIIPVIKKNHFFTNGDKKR